MRPRSKEWPPLIDRSKEPQPVSRATIEYRETLSHIARKGGPSKIRKPERHRSARKRRAA